MAVNLGDPDSDNPKRKRKRRKLILNEKVEVRSVEDGFLGSWHSGTVTVCENRVRHIEYDNLLFDDGSKNLVDVVNVSPTIDGIVTSNVARHNYRGNIRPSPPRLEFVKWGLHYGLCVDALYQDAWWEGVIFDHEDGSEERRIFFPDMGDEETIGIDKLRITQDWDEVTENWDRRGNWLFLELIEEYEKERPLFVSVKQIWYDLREKNGFGKVKEWTSSKKSLWEELVLESINDNLVMTVNEIYRELDFIGNLVPEAQPVLRLPEPDLDVALDPGANLANFCAIVPFENNYLLGSDVTIDHDTKELTLLDSSTNVVDKQVQNDHLENGLPHTNLSSIGIQPVEEKLDMDGLISVMEDDGMGMNLVTNSNTSCHDKAICVQHWGLSVKPSNLDGASGIISKTNSEGFTTRKFHGKPSCSTHSEIQKWFPASPDIVPGAEFYPGAITQYELLSKCGKKPRNSLTTEVRMHLSYLGWKIEFRRDERTDKGKCGKGMIRMRYTSPEGKCYMSLCEVCRDLRALAGALSPISLDDQRSLPTSLDYLSPSLLIEQPQVSKEVTEVPPPSDGIVIEPEYFPQAVVDWYVLGKRMKCLRQDKSLDARLDPKLKAMKHLSAVGWGFWYIYKGPKKKREMRYKSPRGKVYCSLRLACKACMDEGGIYESNATCRAIKSTYGSEEAEVYLASDKLPPAITNTEFEGSLVPLNLPSDKQLTLYPGVSQSNELVELGKVKVRGIRKLRKKRENGLSHLASASFLSQTQGNFQATKDKIEIGLIGRRKRRCPQNQNVSFQNSKRGKLSGPLIKCPPRVLRSRKRARQVVVPSSSHHNPRTVLSWLIDNNVVLPRAKVHYRGREDNRPLAEGRITRDGIKCSCCQKVFTITGFEVHAGSTYRRPAANIFMEDGRSLFECQMQFIGEKNMTGLPTEPCNRLKGHRSHHKNDKICSVCRYGGELILCDQCPSSFHKSCLGLKDVPEGDWFCPSCCCRICGQNKFNENIEHHIDNGVLNCDQCEHQYHVGCLRKRGLVKLESYPKGIWFCNKKCEKIFLGLQKLLGKRVAVGVDNLTWTLLKSTKYDSCNFDALDIEALTESYSKLNVAVGVMHECFEPVKEPYTRRDLVEDVIFSRGSDLNRLNFRGFYTVLLERNDELITVATVRVYGEKVAEVPLVGTRFQYRRLGMCRFLMNELEKKLMELGVERLILPAVPSVLQTWTTAFGFSKMTDSERLEFVGYTFLDFQDTTMCQKLLKKVHSAEASRSRGSRHKSYDVINGDGDNIDFDGYSAISEVFQAEQIEESEIVNQGSVDISVGSGSHGSTGAASLVVVVDQPTHLECKSCNNEICLEFSNEDASHKREVGFKCYKRRRYQPVGAESCSRCAD